MSGSIIKAPWHLWVVGGLSLLWNAFGCFDFTMTATNNADYLASYPQELRDYWMDMPVWVWAIWAIGVFGSLFGSIALLLRRKFAYPLFAASFLAALISMGRSMTDKDAPTMEGQMMMSLVILVIIALLALYARWLSRREVLR
ncbi:hypothetical protein [Hyphomonas sp.]|uniref:hypothetical protein n=1 Tax=Hyphomonas sp. TaxID=87 RepID=UPI000C637611|nr:hypothetical protein [Hyphomonas sp.]MAB11967.1 hypothetical protein [Hyphomonas sp.]MAU66397.1 hypothetical protein [Hyphomonas sp.]